MVADWIKDIVEEETGRARLSIGAIVPRPDGRLVKITGGQYWGKYGVSNFWYWREVIATEAGLELGPEESGYGWL